MRKQDHLVQLIQAMTAGEKKHFRQYMAAGDTSKDYKKLFELLEKSETYDADALSTQLKKSKKNLADDKEYLQAILLRSLHSFHAQSMYRARVFNGLVEADILASKGLMQFALAHVRKLKKGMIADQENILYYQALAQEVSIVRAITPGGLKADEWIKAMGEELIQRLEAGALNNKLIGLCTRIQDLSADVRYIENKAVQKEAKELMEEATQLVKGKKLPSVTNHSYHHLMAQYYFFMGVDTRLSVWHTQQAAERYASETREYQQIHILHYFLCCADLLQAYFELREYKQVESCIQALKEIAALHISKQTRSRAERRVFHYSLLLYTATGEYEKALQYIQSDFPAYKKLTSAEEDLALITLLKAINLFHLQQHEAALSELLLLLSKDAPAQLPETRISARALNLMIQYETGNRLSLPSYIRAAQRFFTNEGLMTREVKLFLELMRYLLRHDKKVPVDAFQKNFKEVYDVHRFELIGYFVIWPWLQRFPKKKL